VRSGQALNLLDGVHAVVVSDGDEGESFTGQVVEELGRRPAPIAEGGMRLEVDGGVGRERQGRGGHIGHTGLQLTLLR
jgi:pentose-5-phosphate-3-epimerase